MTPRVQCAPSREGGGLGLNRFNKTREIFPSVTRVLSILLTLAATSANVERVNSKERVPNVPCSIPAASYAEM